ncbi:MAG: lysoplasmalogenase [Treponema sp.]|nr:lysoplasmalogenase [Treponema sp.]
MEKRTVFTEAVTIACAAVCVIYRMAVPQSSSLIWIIAAAFVLSACGDLLIKSFTKNSAKTCPKKRIKNTSLIYGILFFLCAHVCFIIYILLVNRAFSIIIFMVTAVIFLITFTAAYKKFLKPDGGKNMAAAVLVYILVSCFSLAAAVRPQGMAITGWIYAAGIFSMIISDILIAIQYVTAIWYPGKRQFNWLIMFFYLLSQVLITFSVIAGCHVFD